MSGCMRISTAPDTMEQLKGRRRDGQGRFDRRGDFRSNQRDEKERVRQRNRGSNAQLLEREHTEVGITREGYGWETKIRPRHRFVTKQR